MNDNNPNAKDPRHNPPVDLPGVEPGEYPQYVDSANGSAAQNAGKDKPDAGPPDYTLPGHPSARKQGGQEEGGRSRQPSTSSVSRVGREDKE